MVRVTPIHPRLGPRASPGREALRLQSRSAGGRQQGSALSPALRSCRLRRARHRRGDGDVAAVLRTGLPRPENYIVKFERGQLVANPEGQAVSSSGRPRALVATDIDLFLRASAGRARPDLPRSGNAAAGGTRVAARTISGLGHAGATTPMTSCRTNTGATCAGCPCSKRGSTMPTPAPSVRRTSSRPIGGVTRIRHYLIDFTRSLGSGVQGGPKLTWEGNEPVLPKLSAHRAQHRGHGNRDACVDEGQVSRPSRGGRVRSQTFDPAKWTTNHSIAAVRQSPARRCVLGGQAGHGVQRR